MTTSMDKLIRKLGDYSPISCERRDITGESLVEQVHRKYEGRHVFSVPRRVLRNDLLRLKHELQDRMRYDSDGVTALALLRDFYYIRSISKKKRK